MKSLKDGFIKYLNEKYIEVIKKDIADFVGEETEGSIVNLIVLDSDEPEFQFKVKFRDSFNEYFILEYTCILDDGIKNLKCKKCSDEIANFRYKNALSSDFIPCISREKYDEFAKRFLNACAGPEFSYYPINVLGILSKMNLTSIHSYNINSMGCTIFKDCQLNIRTSDGVSSNKFLKKGTIIINVWNTIKSGGFNLDRSTEIHECVHWHYHKKAFEILMLLNDNYKYLECKNYDTNDAINKMFKFMEIQANALTPIILMDKDCVISELNASRARVESDKELTDLTKIDKLRRVGSELANTFQVTLNYMVKRLVNLGYEEFEPLINKNGVDHFEPTLSKEVLPKNKTRCISKELFKFLVGKNHLLSYLIKKEVLVYTNGYVVFNDKKYLDGTYPSLILNNYARDHIDECSLVFNVERKFNELVFNESNFVSANREQNSCVYFTSISDDQFESIISNFEDKIPNDVKKVIFRTLRKDALDTSFSEYLIDLMDKKEISIRKLAISSGCSESTIKKYRQENYDSYSIEVVLAIAAGLKCYPFHTYNLLKLANFNIEGTSKKIIAYRHLVDECYNYGVRYWNEYLEKEGLHKLNDA